MKKSDDYFTIPLLKIFHEVATNLLTCILGSNLGHIALYHDLHQFLERGGVRIPVELCLCLGWITPQIDNICWTVEIGETSTRVLPIRFSGPSTQIPLLVLILAFPLQFDTYMMESQLGKLSYRVLLTGSDDKVLRLFLPGG